MPTSTYFNKFDNSGEQNLIENLIIETIKIMGHDVYYLPRTQSNLDNLLGEDPLSSFDDAYPIEMYIKNVDGYEGEGTFVSRFGLEIREQITFSVARTRWRSLGLTKVPNEGDLIFFPMTEKLFEIQFVQNEAVFYQAGALQTFDLQCELFEYSDEAIDTDVPQIDAIEDQNAYIRTYPITFVDFGFMLLEDGGFINNEDTPDTAIEGQGNKTIIDTVKLFQSNELITGQLSLTSAKITAANVTHIRITDLTGTLSVGETVIGGSSEAKATIGTQVEESLGGAQALTNDPIANNVTIETVADDIIDFSEDNPFSESY